MADEEAESIGGISVQIGASHARLPGDIAAADQIFEGARAKWEMPIVLRAQAAAPSQTAQPAGRPAPAVRTPSVRVGPGSATRAQAERAQTAFQQAINAKLAETGERYDAQTDSVVSATKATHAQREAVVAVQQQAAAPTSLAIDTAPTQEALNSVLATLREIAAETQKIAALPASRTAGTTSAPTARPAATSRPTAASKPPQVAAATTADAPTPQWARDLMAHYNEVAEKAGIADDIAARSATQTAKQIVRDLGAKIPGQDNAERATLVRSVRATRGIRSQEEAPEPTVPRTEAALAPPPSQRSRGLTDQKRESSNFLNANPPQQSYVGIDSATNINAPNYRSNEEIERERNATQPKRRPYVETPQTNPRPIDPIERQRRSALRDLEEFGRGRGGATGLTDEDYARRAEQRIASSESSRVAAGRTPRTTASGFGGQFLFGGPARQQAEATARQAEAEQRLILSRRRLNDPSIIRDARAYRAATMEQTAAEDNLAKATAKVQSLSGPGTALRSLAAVSVAGAAFGLAMKGVDVAISTLGPALGDAIDKATGFGAVSNRVTQAMAQQTIAAKGNVAAVLAQSEAQAGLSASAADVIDSQIKLTTQVKAGAIAAGQQGGLFRAAIGANQQVPQGLLGGYGGLGGGPLLAQQLGGGAGFAETIKSTFGDFKDSMAALQTNRVLTPTSPTIARQYLTPEQQRGAETPVGQRPEDIARIARDRGAYEGSLNTAIARGATALGAAGGAIAHFTTITADQAKALQTSNLPDELKGLAKDSNEALIDSSGNLVTAFKTATDALEQAAAGLSIPDAATLGRVALANEKQRQIESAASVPAIQAQQAFERPARIAAVGRQTDYEVNTQLPAQVALSTLASPNVPVGTGIPGADQSSRKADMKEANDLQKQINANAAIGQQIINDTYRPAILTNFGTVALQQFDAALSAVKATGAEIASIQAGISNEQAAYQVAQYNFQLQIARRTLSDIGGLTGKNFGAGESYLGVLERQNLALSRQSQMLGFALSQRQINFQTALAGFQAPGVTPEERQARIEEAKTEAGFAQKQLDISKQIFGNQVQIVDISNLRQGADLAKQIALLVQGRKVTIDTAASEQKLLRLQQLQQQNVAKVSAYMNAVDTLAGAAFAEIQRLETAAGHALTSAGKLAILTVYGFFRNLTNMFKGTGAQTLVQMTQNSREHASGGIFETRGMSQITPRDTVGEAGGETVAILSHPRPLNSGGGGMTVSISFTGDIKANDAGDLEKVTAAVIKGLGRQASILGLRGVG